MFKSASFKLTMWYLAIVMAISIVFSVLLYHVTTGQLNVGLHNETQRIYNQFPVFQNNSLLRGDVDYTTTAHRILLRLFFFNVVVLILAGFASNWLARRTLEPIEAAHEQQKRFTADVSHELRTPLTALRMESEVALMNKKGSSSELRATLLSNLEEVDKLEGLINNLLRLTRLEAGEMQQHFEPLSASAIVEAAVSEIDLAATNHHIRLNSSVSDLPLVGDRDSLVQLIVILLDNAIKYSPANSSVEITSQRSNDQTIIRIKDDGSGIEPAALEHIFDRFYRADSSRNKATTEGFGLGLSIAKMIADVHNGSIVIKSQPGQGTTAIISLPSGADTPKKSA